jgi:hypothetical protein
VRSFPAYRGQRNYPGFYYAAALDAHVVFESWRLERDAAMAMDFGGDVVLVGHLVGSLGFAILGAAQPPASVLAGQLLNDLPAEVAARAREWERHVVEVETGLPPGAAPGTAPRPEFDPQLRTVRQRGAAKAEELTAAGTPTSAITVQRMRQRYRIAGLRGLVEGRTQRRSTPHGRTDERVVAAVREALRPAVIRRDHATGSRRMVRRWSCGVAAVKGSRWISWWAPTRRRPRADAKAPSRASVPNSSANGP